MRPPSTSRLVWFLATSMAAQTLDFQRQLDQLTGALRWHAAEQAARLELTTLERRGEGETEGAAAILDQLSEILRVGTEPRTSEAAAAAVRAVRIKEGLFGPNDRRVADSLHHLAGAYSANADSVRAIAAAERELAIRDRFPADSATALCLDQLAVTYYEAGYLSRVRAPLERALAIDLRVHGENHPATAQVLNDLGVLLWRTGEYRAGKPYLVRALAVRERLYGPDATVLAPSLNNLALVEAELGALAEARKLHGRAMAINERILGPDRPRIAAAFQRLAFVLGCSGDYQGALAVRDTAIALRERPLGPQHPLVALSWANLAQSLYLAGNREKALEAALQAEDIDRRQLTATIRVLPARGALLYSASRVNGLDTVLSFTQSPGTAGETRLIWDCLVRSRALVLDEMAERHRSLWRTGTTDGQVPLRELAAARERLAHLVVEGPGELALAAYSKRLQDARTAEEQAERSLARVSGAFRQDLEWTGAGLAEVAAALPAATALVAVARYHHRFTGTDSPSWPAYVAFVLPGPGREPVAVWLGKAAPIDCLIEKWRAQMTMEAGSPGMAPAIRERTCRQAGLALRRAVWDRLAPHLKGARQVLLVADGSLSLVNFAALPGPGSSYLAESGPVLQSLTSERDLVRARASRRGSGLLALGNPNFAFQPSAASRICSQFQNLRLSPIPGSAHEIERLAAVWKTGGGAGPVDLLLGAGASEDAFRSHYPGKRVIHLATHAFFLNSGCGTAVGDENPLLRSGLVLAGSPPQFLTAEEIAGFSLDSLEWAVLSGCGTGLGQVTSGESVLGLPRAFQLAGASTVIMSLWPVEDQSAAEWMEELYRLHFSRRLPTAEAVRGAYLHVLKLRRERKQSTHPFYWAPFLALGPPD